MKIIVWVIAWIVFTFAIWPLPLANYMIAMAMVVVMGIMDRLD